MTVRIRCRRFDPLFGLRFIVGLIRLAEKVRADAHAGPAVHPAASGRSRAAGNSPSGRTAGAVGSALHGRPGCNSDQFPLHEDVE